MKLIYDSIAGTLHPWPCAEDETPVSIEPHLWAMDVIQDAAPPLLPRQSARATETIDVENRRVLRGFQIVTPPAQWNGVQDFLAAFTDAEKAAIEMSTDPTIAGMRLTLSGWESAVHPDDARVQGCLNRLVTLGILTTERKAAIIATAA